MYHTYVVQNSEEGRSPATSSSNKLLETIVEYTRDTPTRESKQSK